MKPTTVDITKLRDFQVGPGSPSDHRRTEPVTKTVFMPYVMSRSHLGDKGSRPLASGTAFWESPDIWTFSSHPDDAPITPPVVAGSVTSNRPNTVYAHVWNLGRAPVAGAVVEWYWADPSFEFDTARANLIGMERVDLAPNGFAGCHRLVKCTSPWVPSDSVGVHQCLVSRVSALGDGLTDFDSWSPIQDRHVAQRNVSVLTANSSRVLSEIATALSKSSAQDDSFEVWQQGKSADGLVRLIAPHLTVDLNIRDMKLVDLDERGNLSMSVDALRNLVVSTDGFFSGSDREPRLGSARALDSNRTFLTNANLLDAIGFEQLLPMQVLNQIKFYSPNREKAAIVLRIICKRKRTVVGGYTLILSP
jgi:hypothetical protein